jgi:hypothetical protein
MLSLLSQVDQFSPGFKKVFWQLAGFIVIIGYSVELEPLLIHLSALPRGISIVQGNYRTSSLFPRVRIKDI